MKLKCAICGKWKPKDEFPIVEYVIRSSDAGEEVIGRYFCICHECLKRVRLALQRLVTYERSSDLEYLRRLLYHLRRRTI